MTAPTDTAHRKITELLHDMLAADGYEARIAEWPAAATGHVRIEIAASPEACSDCLVPKAMLCTVIQNELPPGLVVEESDVTYPND